MLVFKNMLNIFFKWIEQEEKFKHFTLKIVFFIQYMNANANAHANAMFKYSFV